MKPSDRVQSIRDIQYYGIVIAAGTLGIIEDVDAEDYYFPFIVKFNGDVESFLCGYDDIALLPAPTDMDRRARLIAAKQRGEDIDAIVNDPALSHDAKVEAIRKAAGK